MSWPTQIILFFRELLIPCKRGACLRGWAGDFRTRCMWACSVRQPSHRVPMLLVFGCALSRGKAFQEYLEMKVPKLPVELSK